MTEQGAARPAAALRASACALAAALTLSCAPHPSPAPPPAAQPAPTRPTPNPETRGRLPARFVAGPGSYDITTVGTVSSEADTARPDTIRTTTALTYDARWNGPRLLVVGTVTSRVTTSSPGLRGAAPAAAAPVPFRATVDSESGAVTFDGAATGAATGVTRAGTTGAADSGATTTCPPGGPADAQARELATSRPRSFAPGATWADTVTDRSCLGGVPLTSRAVREFTVAPGTTADPVVHAPAILVTHTSRVTMEGGGRRTGQLITLTGSGSGSTEQYFDRGSGVLLSAHTAASLDLDVGVSGRVQRLHQHADWQATRH